jgi:hypothetical protein
MGGESAGGRARPRDFHSHRPAQDSSEPRHGLPSHRRNRRGGIAGAARGSCEGEGLALISVRGGEEDRRARMVMLAGGAGEFRTSAPVR